MSKFTGFDHTMDMSAVLSVMCETDPFISSGAAVDAKALRSYVRNKWAHCDFQSGLNQVLTMHFRKWSFW